MAQSAGQSGGGGKTTGDYIVLALDVRRATNAMGVLVQSFSMGDMAKHSINPKNFYYASTLTAAQVTALPEEVDGKDRLASEQTLISNLHLCLGEKGQDELQKRRPHLDLSTTR